MTGRIQTFCSAITVTDTTVELHPTLGDDQKSRLFLETRAVAQKGGLFADLFDREVELITPKA